jgi:hypothetical protein
VKEHPEYDSGFLTEDQRMNLVDFIVFSFQQYERRLLGEGQLGREDFLELFRLAVRKDHLILLPDVLPLPHLDIVSNHESLRGVTGSRLDAPSNAAKDDENESATETEVKMRYNCSICGKLKLNHICLPHSNEPTMQNAAVDEVENTSTTITRPDKVRHEKYIRLFDAWSQVSDSSKERPEGDDSQANARVNRTGPLMAKETRIPAEIFQKKIQGNRVRVVSNRAMEWIENEGRQPEVQGDIADSDLQRQEEKELDISEKVKQLLKEMEQRKQAELDAIRRKTNEMGPSHHPESAPGVPVQEVEIHHRVDHQVRWLCFTHVRKHKNDLILLVACELTRTWSRFSGF